MLKIINLESTLRGFANQLGERYARLGFQGRQIVSIGIEGTEQVVEIEFTPEKVNIGRSYQASETLILPEREMVRFIFGPGTSNTTAKLPARLQFLDALFPVDFYLWGNETV